MSSDDASKLPTVGGLASTASTSESERRRTPELVGMATEPSNAEPGMTTAARKRDRDSQFGPTTPSGDETSFAVGEHGSGGTVTHAAKKNRVLSRDNSAIGQGLTRSRDMRNTEGDIDIEVSPPGTPTAAAPSRFSAPASPAIPARSIDPTHMDADATPPGTPPLTASRVATTLRQPITETTRVKEMRERVQEMTTAGDEELLTAEQERTPPPISAIPSAPGTPLASYANLPASAAEAENAPEFQNHKPGDVIIEEPDEMSDDHHANILPPSMPLTAPVVSALPRDNLHLRGPPSPSNSSVLADSGSVAGDSDSVRDGQDVNGPLRRPGGSRMSSISSMRSLYTSNAPTSLLHSSLPHSTSSLDVPSDALSDVSVEVNPPGTPRVAAGEGDSSSTAPPTPLTATAGAVAQEETGTDPPPPTPAGASVQANFGRPSSPFTATPSKAFVNPFASFGASAASPFASSSSSGSAFAAKSNAPSTSSNLSTAKPFGPSGFGTTGGASPFASTSGRTAFAPAPRQQAREANGDDEDDEEKDVGQIKTSADDMKEDKIFSSQNEVHITTGEEDEYTQYAVPRAKLYVMDGTEWKERGVGQIRLNQRSDDDGDITGVRLIMRAEAVHRLILNVPVFAGMAVTLAQDKFVRFSAFEDGKLRHFTLRIGNPQQSQELYAHINDMIKSLPSGTEKRVDDGEKV